MSPTCLSFSVGRKSMLSAGGLTSARQNAPRVAVPLRVRARVGGTGRAILVHMWGWAPRWMRAVAPPPTIVLAPALLRKRPPPSVQGADADSHPDLVGARPLHLVFNLSCPSACAGDADEPFRLANEISARCLQTASEWPQFPGVRAPPRPRSRPPGAPLISTPTSNHCALKSGVRRASSPFRLLSDALCWFQNMVASETPGTPC